MYLLLKLQYKYLSRKKENHYYSMKIINKTGNRFVSNYIIDY